MNKAVSSNGLLGKAKTAAIWGYIGTLGRVAIQLIAQIVLARIIGPAEYGVFAVGAIIVGIANYIADGGIGASLIQKSRLDDEITIFVSTWQNITGAVTFFFIWIFAPYFSAFFNAGDSAPSVIRLMGIVCWLSSIGSVSMNLLRRNLDYRGIQISQLSGIFFGYAFVGIPLAHFGAGVWSLAFAWVAQVVLTTIILFVRARPPIGIRFRHPEEKELTKFGLSALVSNISTWLGTSIDKTIVGYGYLPSQLANYTVASNLIFTATSQILSTAQQVIFATASRDSSQNRENIKKALHLLLEVGGLIFLPLMFVISTSSDTIISALYGSEWMDAALVLSPAALTMAFYGLSGLLTPLLWSIGKVSSDAKAQFVGAVMIGIAAYASITASNPAAIAWAVLPCVLIRAIWTVRQISRAVGATRAEMARSLIGGVVAAIAIGVLVNGVMYIAFSSQLSPALQMLTLVFTCFLCFPVVIGVVIYTTGTRELNDLIRPRLLPYFAGR
ncbi:polysaccharide biosynthesis protein [Leptothrix cholodnii SP-6]|uniref:Polysaccharide biosynthesis protein n=1 Tax=Leptothrix cholodnii (strain ATCC 51168 / LMG 8142 / SP-6) TaxID=395495 RepID=B1Y4P9_LEPCP|nr:oligosaccharide flippase family protein [Leptothrix cholodnii]ACB34612.1 polysaccharide biosynthesis protein [Leptothrix cholodnii SP-6]